MRLYHGSKKKFKKLLRKKAYAPLGRPKEEAMDGIYLTSDWEFALISGARPLGLTTVNFKEKTVKFENPIDGEARVYIYVVDSEKIPSSKMKWIDDYQVVVDADELAVDAVEIHKAAEVGEHYTILI